MNTKIIKILILLFLFAGFWAGCSFKKDNNSVPKLTDGQLLKWDDFSEYIKEFNTKDEELYIQYYPNNKAENFLKENIPLFQCPDTELEKTYYFRWWTFRKHIKNTPDGFVITEFLPDVPWAGKYNTINCPAGHHFYEGRWLHDPAYLRDYANFWFQGGGNPRLYSFWAANSILAFSTVHNERELLTKLLPYFVMNYESWENERLCSDGLFWQYDGRDGMEVSVGGSGKRATINSYMIGEAEAIAGIAKIAGNISLTNQYSEKAKRLKKLMLTTLWDKKNNFFKTLPLNTREINNLNELPGKETFTRYSKDNPELVNVRELHGYTPWYFNIPGEDHSSAWKFILSEEGFKAPYGPTTAEQSHPGFKIAYEGHECQWNGPTWPFATSVTLKAMANLLRNYNQTIITKNDFIELLTTYSNSHRKQNEKGEMICWIDENLNPFSGDWISRTLLQKRGQKPVERGKDYNHSAFCDFIISDLVGIRPSMDNSLTIHPLVPDNYWDWFCLDRVKYHNKIITVIWDKDGKKYKKGKGLSVFIDGTLKHNASNLEYVIIEI